MPASMANDFVGRGWAFPLRVGPRGGIALSHGGEEIDGALRMILQTAPGERVMRPEFGCAIWDQLFAPVDANALGLMAQAVRDAVGRWEPRVECEDVTVSPDPDDATRVTIEVTYRIKATNDRRNLVHPFYTIPRETNPRNASPRETNPRNASPRETNPRNASPRDASPGDASPGEASPRDAGHQETSPNERQPGRQPAEGGSRR